MKLKSKTIALLAVAILSACGLYIWDKNRAPASDTASKSAETVLFTVKESDIDRLDIQAQSGRVVLERQAKGWQLTAPQSGSADEATVAFLLNLLATGRSERSLTVDASDLKQFNLVQPIATLAFRLKNQQSHELRLGTQTFDQSAVYALADPPETNAKRSVVLLPTSFLNAVSRPLSNWQAKPKGSASAPPSSAIPTPGSANSTPTSSTPSDSALSPALAPSSSASSTPAKP